MNMDDIKIIPAARQIIHAKLGQFCKETRGSDLYHMMEVFELLRSIVGDEPLKEHYGERYEEKRMLLHTLNVRLNKVKTYYDSIQNFDEKLKEVKLKQLFMNEYKRIPLINMDLFKAFDILIGRTEIKFMPIPHEYMKRMEKEHKTIGSEQEQMET